MIWPYAANEYISNVENFLDYFASEELLRYCFLEVPEMFKLVVFDLTNFLEKM